MEIKILERDAETIRFLLKGVSPAFANALRRSIISEVPVMAIDDVMIVENNSIMYDEILAHRLGLIPLKTDLDGYVLPEDCDCKSELGCNKCRASLTLQVETKETSLTVYSGELKSETDVVPVSDKIPITKLGPFQKIKLEAYAKLGRGREHAKWKAVAICAYKILNDDEFEFLVESNGSLPPDRVVEEGANVLQDKANHFLKEASKILK